eukprot:377115-Prorocentrum_minimum.AAC.2
MFCCHCRRPGASRGEESAEEWAREVADEEKCEKGRRREQGRQSLGGLAGRFGAREGIYRSSLDARKPQDPTKSEEYQGHLQ